jgi:thymidylate synthase (FAD)
MRDRHGSPFEHSSMTFLITAPIFVFREFHRHRAGWS